MRASLLGSCIPSLYAARLPVFVSFIPRYQFMRSGDSPAVLRQTGKGPHAMGTFGHETEMFMDRVAPV